MSLKGDKYETQEEVKFRLENTVVMYDGEPVYITSVANVEAEDKAEIARVFFQTLPYNPRNKSVRKYLSSKKFDLAPFKMGYMNHGGEAIFVSRIPIRQNRQGLSQGATLFKDIRGRNAENINFSHMIQSPGFVEMVQGKYPSFKDAGALLADKESSSVAISRSFAFAIDNDLDALLLLHRGQKCGIAMRGDDSIKLPKKFHFLREEMEECRIPIS
jgi:hypothetical protein